MSRPRVRPTARLAGMLAAAGLVYVFATNSEVVWLYLVAGLILALLPVGLAGPPLGLRRLRLEVGERRREGFEPPLRQDRGGVFAGDRVSIRLRAARGSLLGCQAGAIRFGLDRADGPEAPGPGWNVGLEVDPSGRSAWLHLQPPRRGLYRIALLDLRSGWPLGLLQATRRVALEADLLVLPRYWLPPGERPADRTEGGEAARRRGLGEDFVGLREYQPSDPQRRIHWPTSARTGALMVVATAAPSLDPAAYA
ncbi:MAG TPA: DUF58 domain-containing protein, partial [Candidatus Dormibacteraeota bacterium]|nr:DUF58 domain-containing protein [Candidatus Dormibacteraeota bacterium]